MAVLLSEIESKTLTRRNKKSHSYILFALTWVINWVSVTVCFSGCHCGLKIITFCKQTNEDWTENREIDINKTITQLPSAPCFPLINTLLSCNCV